jgi:hypothetical protein
MKKIYSFALTLLVGAASLTSCSRANYAFTNKVPAYLNSEQTATDTAQLPNAPEVVVKTENLPVAGNPAIAPSVQSPAASVAARTLAIPPAKVVRQSLAQRLVVKQLTKQLNKVAAHSHNAARTEHTASAAGRAGLVILAGVIILLIGGLIGGLNFVATIGGIVFLVGLILLILALIRG